ncbi:MAG: HAD-IIB family hydrolase, partial [Lachnospiraceae bacterium]|nr:HAD-IIB family hydrolase [Lachnospiraceae bacterium]
MNYQMLVLDLDGTLTNSNKEISGATRDALIDIQRQGKKVVLASGRPTKGVLPLAEQLRLIEFGSYIVSFTGGRITD